MQHVYAPVLRYGFGILALAAGFLLLFFISWPYESLLPVFAAFNSDKPWLRELLVDIKHTFGLSENVYYAAKISVLILLMACLLALSRLKTNVKKSFPANFFPTQTVAFFGRKLHDQWQRLPVWEQRLLIITSVVLLSVRLYLLQLFELEIDEASEYFLFLNRGLPGVITYYAIPNNHVFYSLLCLPLLSVFHDPWWAYKLPTLLISTLGFPVLYLAVRSVFNFTITFFSVCGLSFSYHLLYYAVHGRGYSLLLFCTAFAFIAILKLYEKSEAYYWLVFMLCTVIGFYTVPVFLYPFVSLSVFAVLAFLQARNFRALRQLVLATFFAGITTVLLYLPIMLVSSPELLFGNVYVVRQPYAVLLQRLTFFFPFTQGSALGQETIGAYLWLLGVLCLLLLLVFRKRAAGFLEYADLKPVYFVWILCGALIPWFMILVQGVLPPERVWTYKVFVDFLALAVLLQLAFYVFILRARRLAIMFVVATVGFYGTYETVKLWRNKHVPHTSNAPFFELLTKIRQQPDPVIYTSDGYYSFFLRYEFLAKERRSPNIDEFEPEPGKTYNVLILSRRNPIPAEFDLRRYRLVHQDAFVQLYFLALQR